MANPKATAALGIAAGLGGMYLSGIAGSKIGRKKLTQEFKEFNREENIRIREMAYGHGARDAMAYFTDKKAFK